MKKVKINEIITILAILAFEVIDEETIVYSIFDQGIFLDKFSFNNNQGLDAHAQRNYKILISERKEILLTPK